MSLERAIEILRLKSGKRRIYTPVLQQVLRPNLSARPRCMQDFVPPRRYKGYNSALEKPQTTLIKECILAATIPGG